MRSAQLSPGSTRLIVELSASRVPRRAHSSNYQPDSSNYQPDSSNYQLKADNPANNPAVSFVVWAHAAAYTSKGRAFPETVPIEFIRALQGQSNKDNHRVCTGQDNEVLFDMRDKAVQRIAAKNSILYIIACCAATHIHFSVT